MRVTVEKEDIIALVIAIVFSIVAVAVHLAW